jgi:hypothetical protein
MLLKTRADTQTDIWMEAVDAAATHQERVHRLKQSSAPTSLVHITRRD